MVKKKVAKIERKEGYMYYVDGKGNVMEMSRKKSKNSKNSNDKKNGKKNNSSKKK